MHPDGHHAQVGFAGVVEEASHVSDQRRVHKRLGHATAAALACVFSYSDDVIIVLRFLLKLSPSGLLKPDHLPGVLAHKRPSWDGLEGPNPPAPTLGSEHLKPVN